MNFRKIFEDLFTFTLFFNATVKLLCEKNALVEISMIAERSSVNHGNYWFYNGTYNDARNDVHRPYNVRANNHRTNYHPNNRGD